MSYSHRFGKSLTSHSWNPPHRLDHLVMLFLGSFENHHRVIHCPSPGCGNGVSAMAPAKHALVATRKRWCGLHAEVGFDAIEGVLVAASTSTQGGFGPAAELDPAM